MIIPDYRTLQLIYQLRQIPRPINVHGQEMNKQPGCKGICKNIYEVRIFASLNKEYRRLGFKKCSTCGFLTNTDDARCGCCHRVLKTRIAP